MDRNLDGDTWRIVYQSIDCAARAIRSPGRTPVYSARLIVAMFCWAVVHDQCLSWACDRRHYHSLFRPRRLPSVSQFTRRIKGSTEAAILQRVHDDLAGRGIPLPLNTAAAELSGWQVAAGQQRKQGSGRGGWAHLPCLCAGIQTARVHQRESADSPVERDTTEHARNRCSAGLAGSRGSAGGRAFGADAGGSWLRRGSAVHASRHQWPCVADAVAGSSLRRSQRPNGRHARRDGAGATRGFATVGRTSQPGAIRDEKTI
jgi:hypothetical protein